MTSYSVPLPLDNGFLRRECPHCERQFKWHHGPTPNRPPDAVDPAVYFCPYCGDTALPDHWWTKEQAAYVRDTIAGPAVRAMADELKRTFKNDSSSLIRFDVDYKQPEPPPSLHEPNDMVLIEPPCHTWEPLKVDAAWREPIHCLICGTPFAIS
jgi:hypothetical protein